MNSQLVVESTPSIGRQCDVREIAIKQRRVPRINLLIDLIDILDLSDINSPLVRVQHRNTVAPNFLVSGPSTNIDLALSLCVVEDGVRCVSIIIPQGARKDAIYAFVLTGRQTKAISTIIVQEVVLFCQDSAEIKCDIVR